MHLLGCPNQQMEHQRMLIIYRSNKLLKSNKITHLEEHLTLFIRSKSFSSSASWHNTSQFLEHLCRFIIQKEIKTFNFQINAQIYQKQHIDASRSRVVLLKLTLRFLSFSIILVTHLLWVGLHFVGELLHDVGIINVIFNRVRNRVMSSDLVELEIRFMMSFHSFQLSLLFDLRSKLKMIKPLPFCKADLILDLMSSILFVKLRFLIVSHSFLEFSVLFQLQLLQKPQIHKFVRLLLSSLILILCPEERLPSIISLLNQVFELLRSLFIIIHITFPWVIRYGLIDAHILQGQHGIIQRRQGRIAGDGIFIDSAIKHHLRILDNSHFLLFLELHSLLKLIIINSFESVFIIKAWISIDFYLLNDSGVNFLPKLLSMMFLICVVDAVDFLHAVFQIRRIILIQSIITFKDQEFKVRQSIKNWIKQDISNQQPKEQIASRLQDIGTVPTFTVVGVSAFERRAVI